MLRSWLKAGALVALFAGGVFALVAIAGARPGPERLPAEDRVVPVRSLRVVASDVVPILVGYGTARPRRVWQAVAQVGGRVVGKFPRLEAGILVPAETMLVTIDPREYVQSVRELEATVASQRAQQVELETTAVNTRASLAIERQSLALAVDELDRQIGMAAAGKIPQSQVDAQERLVLSLRAAVQSLENALRLDDVRSRSLAASIAASEARLETARLRLSYTRIVAPFDCRIAEASVELNQSVSAGQALLEVHGLEVADITAQVPIHALGQLLADDRRRLTQGELLDPDVFTKLRLSAVVRQQLGDAVAEWDAQVARIASALDPATRTIGVVVAVEEPYAQAEPGVRPPIFEGAFCEVELRGPRKPGQILVPRAALHGDEVYVIDADGRLERRRVEIGFSQLDHVVLRAGLAAGETIVLSDLVPAIEGTRLAPTEDSVAVRARTRAAAGRDAR